MRDPPESERKLQTWTSNPNSPGNGYLFLSVSAGRWVRHIVRRMVKCSICSNQWMTDRHLSGSSVAHWTCTLIMSRTDRVALDWLFDRINLDPKIQIKFVDTRNQLVDLLTKGTFTRHELQHLLCLFHIMSKSMFSCSHFSKEMDESLATSKRLMQDKQQGEEEERVVAKSRPVRLLVCLLPRRVLLCTA